MRQLITRKATSANAPSFPVSSCVLHRGQVTVEEPPVPQATVRLAESTLVARADARVPRPDGTPSSNVREQGRAGLIVTSKLIAVQKKRILNGADRMWMRPKCINAAVCVT
ncbi:hypothetical protein Q8A67_015920 [Cirrhinus molitorella]|uniref:Uncharacterized protein n=1 Tax=Cirrhinus molitorella TaxID=172907 RepID=A0AA88TTV2_9TELE|nr:hypothetical protein Q8A67_015920 [Cirrhinus molitorella]